MLNINNDWELNVLGIYNFNKPGKLGEYFKHIEEHHVSMEGDIAEFGVFRGSSILATGLLLKQLGSKKKVYGYDSFSGFPSYHRFDDLREFEQLFKIGQISLEHIEAVRKNISYRQFIIKSRIDVKNISSSGDFSDNSLELLQEKIKLLELENIVLVQGDFAQTATTKNDRPIMAALVDCDLYDGYKTCLPFIWRNLSRGGYVFLDEYYSLKFPGAKIATDEFFTDKPSKPQMHKLLPGDFERWFFRKY